MKMLFTAIALSLSLTAFAERTGVECNIGIQGEEYISMEYSFSNQTSAQSYVLANNAKIPAVSTEVSLMGSDRIVTSVTGVENANTVSAMLPYEIFADDEENSFYMITATVDDRDVYGICVGL